MLIRVLSNRAKNREGIPEVNTGDKNLIQLTSMKYSCHESDTNDVNPIQLTHESFTVDS